MPFIPSVEESGIKLEAWPPQMPGPLVVAILDGPDEREGRTTAILAEGFAYRHPASGGELKVPEGFITDFASIPRLVRGLFPSFGRHAKAAVLHDWLYLVGEPGKRAFADRIFLDAMEELGVSGFRRKSMYAAVRAAGGDGYKREWLGWDRAFGDWRTGERTLPNGPRDDWYQRHWPRPPREDYQP
jgi:hypothetical protein